MGQPDGNLGPRQVRLRRTAGLVALAAAVAASAWMVATGLGRPWRLAVYPAFAFALLSLEQARTHV